MVNESIPSSVVDLLSLAIGDLEAMRRAPIVEVRVGALHSTLSSSDSRIGELGSQFASNKSELNMATTELESIKRRLSFADGSASLMQQQTRSQGPQLREGEPVRVSAEGVPAAPESSVQSLTASERVLQHGAAS